MPNDRDDAMRTQALEDALAAFRATGAEHRNCAQAVMLFALGVCGGETACVETARYLGGGLGRSGRTCGAITGAALALGVRDSADPETWARRGAEGCTQLQSLMADFEAAFGDTRCSALTGCDLSTPDGYRAFAAQGVREGRCVGMIEWMCRRLADVL